ANRRRAVNLELHRQRAVRGFEDRDLLLVDVVRARDAILAVRTLGGFLPDQRADTGRLLRVDSDLGRDRRESIPGASERWQGDEDQCEGEEAFHGQSPWWRDHLRRGAPTKTRRFAIMGGFGVEL